MVALGGCQAHDSVEKCIVMMKFISYLLFCAPVIRDITLRSTSMVQGGAHGFYNAGNYKMALKLALVGLEKTKGMESKNDQWQWWEFMKLAIDTGIKLNNESDYEAVKQYALTDYSPSSREVAKYYLRLSMLGFNFNDKAIVDLAEMALKADESWGEPEFMLGWYMLKENIDAAISHFKKAIEKDASYKERIREDEVCNRYPQVAEIIGG